MHSADARVALQINSLLGAFEKHTGQSFSGSDSDYSILSELVSMLCGLDTVFSLWHSVEYISLG